MLEQVNGTCILMIMMTIMSQMFVFVLTIHHPGILMILM